MISRFSALCACLPLLVGVFVIPSASADVNADCQLLRGAAGEYTQHAIQLASLRKKADSQQEDWAALKGTQIQIVEKTRTIGKKLRTLSHLLADPMLNYVYGRDADLFLLYAETLEGAINNGDIGGTNIHVTTSYTRSIEAIEEANKAFHDKCL